MKMPTEVKKRLYAFLTVAVDSRRGQGKGDLQLSRKPIF
jgi:hypothetical protein